MPRRINRFSKKTKMETDKSLQATEDILALIASDAWMMQVLQTARELKLLDWWIGAGFVRNKVWDAFHGYEQRTPINDVDVIYFDATDTNEATEKEYEHQLKKIDSSVLWSVKNQARMHNYHHVAPFKDTIDAVRHWVETPTCVAVTMDIDDRLRLAAPVGIDDLIHLNVRLNPQFSGTVEEYRKRIAQKQWQRHWPKLTIIQ